MWQKALTKRLEMAAVMTLKTKRSLRLILATSFALPFMSPFAVAQMPTPSDSAMTESWEASPPSEGRILRTSSDRWVPPDIDDAVPPVSQKESCRLGDIVQNAGFKMKQFVDDLGHFTATETVTHQTVTRSGTLREAEKHKYEYVVSVRESKAGPYIEEYRDRDLSPTPKPSSDGITVQRVIILALIFHPSYAKGYEMTCEGLGVWNGQPAWQIRFEELPNCAQPMIRLALPRKAYDLELRGRAWFLVDSYGLAAIETDLRRTIPEIGLRLDHELIEYGPALASNGHAVRWLPLRAQVHMDFQHHRFYQSQTFTNFHFFSVGIQQDIGNLR
jgi:hypothetical protein